MDLDAVGVMFVVFVRDVAGDIISQTPNLIRTQANQIIRRARPQNRENLGRDVTVVVFVVWVGQEGGLSLLRDSLRQTN
jgi:hypothetical protein